MRYFYVYALLDPRKGPRTYGEFSFEHLPKYIGKGSGNRIVYSAPKEGASKAKREWIRELEKLDLEPIAIKVRARLTEEQAFDLERELIRIIGRKRMKEGPLVNYQARGWVGTGGRQASHEKIKEYKQFVKQHKFPMREEFAGKHGWVNHECSKHGLQSATPSKVVRRINSGLPPCPRCCEEHGSEKMAVGRRQEGADKFAKWFKKHCAPHGYKVLSEYRNTRTADGKKMKFRCPKHGVWPAYPGSLKSLVRKGRKCCLECSPAVIDREPCIQGRRASELAKYRAFLKENWGTRYRITKVDEATYSGLQDVEHSCPKHGKFFRKPQHVKASFTKYEVPPCTCCMKEQKVVSNQHIASKNSRDRKFKKREFERITPQ